MSQRTLWPSPYGKIASRMIFANLLKDVIRQGLCIGCGTCVAVCPVNALIMQDETPRLMGACIRCGYCYYSCPITTDEHFKGFENEQKRIELKAFEKVREEPFGVYDTIYVAKDAKLENILRAILRYLLESKIIDLIATYGNLNPVLDNMVSKPRPSILPSPILIDNPDKIEEVNFLTIFSPPSALSLRAAADEYYASFFQASYKPSICYLAPPSHIRAIWRMRLGWYSNSKIEECIKLLITIFNRNYYSITQLKKILLEKNVDISKITDFKILDGGIEFLYNGKSVILSNEELNKALHGGMSKIKDITGEYADISIGNIQNMTIIIIRNKSYKGYVESAIEARGIKLEEASDEILELLRGLYQ